MSENSESFCLYSFVNAYFSFQKNKLEMDRNKLWRPWEISLVLKMKHDKCRNLGKIKDEVEKKLPWAYFPKEQKMTLNC